MGTVPIYPFLFRWRGHHESSAFEVLLDWFIEILRGLQSGELIDVSDVLPEQGIEDRIAIAGEIISKPPHPVAAFGNEQLLVSKRPLPFGDVTLALHEGRTRRDNPPPGLLIFSMSNPDVEVRVCPRTRSKPIQFFGGHSIARFGKRDGFEPGFFADAVVEITQEISPAVRIVIPGILTIE